MQQAGIEPRISGLQLSALPTSPPEQLSKLLWSPAFLVHKKVGGFSWCSCTKKEHVMLLFVFLRSQRFDFRLRYGVLKLFLPAFECRIASKNRIKFPDAPVHKTTYAPLNFTALCIIFSGGNVSLLGGLGPWISTFLGSKSHSPNGSCNFKDPKKVSIHGPNPPRNEKNPPEKIIHGTVKFIGA